MIGIVGSGNVGANIAFFLAEKGVDHVLLYDLQEGMAKGKALDMMEAAPIRGYGTTINGTDQLDDILSCDIIIITAGAVRKPGMKRESLFQDNKKIIETYAGKITRPNTKVIIVSEPVDPLTCLFAEKSTLPASQIMGLGGVLDATRLRYLIANELGVDMENVSAQVVGRHADDMIILENYCCVSGISIDNFMTPEKTEALFEQTRNAGALIVNLAGRASAYYGPSAVAADLAEAICLDAGRLMSVSQVLTGQFGIKNAALSLPAVIGKNGISRVVEPLLGDEALEQLKESAFTVNRIIEEVA